MLPSSSGTHVHPTQSGLVEKLVDVVLYFENIKLNTLWCIQAVE